MITPLLLLFASANSGYALIVTNNRSLELSRPDLRYADDDGVKYAQLFGEMFGEDHVQLLTELDPETRALYPDWVGRTHRPTWTGLDDAVDELVARLTNDPGAEAWIVLAGHGDLERGQGYLELADRRLYARDLEHRVIAPLQNTRIHLLLDSCNSYFMLNPRKPGGVRFTQSNADTRDLLERYPNVGALISTSAEAVTYEWSDVQSGIFSYEVRSGLRGGADANSDQMITYAELSAFLDTANRSVENDLYRPKVYTRGPNNDRDITLLDLHRSGSRAMLLERKNVRRITVRDRFGVRVLDLHKEEGTALELRLPDGELGIYERLIGENGRAQLVHRTLTSSVSAPITLGERGEAPVFQRLFDAPFGAEAMRLYQSVSIAAPAPVYGISRRDADRLGLYLRTTAAYERESRTLAGSVFLAMSAGTAIGAGLLIDEDDKLTLGTTLLIGASVGLAASGALSLLLSSESEDLLEAYSRRDLSTESARGEAVFEAETRLRTIAEDYEATRHLTGIASLVMSAAAIGFVGVHAATAENERRLAPIDSVTLGSAAVLAAMGLYQLLIQKHPAEHTWELYQQELSLRE
jgi:hypothetical protein